MDIDDPGAPDQLDRFRDKIRARAAEAGREAGVAYAEQFKLLTKL
jgi:hypothetical protein